MMQFQTTAFGLAIAPRVFTNLLRTPIALLRRMCIRLIVYMDDILIMNQSYQGVQSDLQTVVAMMEGLGFLINKAKSELNPEQTIELLGYMVDSIEMSLSLPKGEIMKIKQCCLDMLSDQSVTVRKLTQLIGKLTATNQGMLAVPLHYRNLQNLKTKCLHAGGHYDYQVFLDQDSISEIRWWISRLELWNGKTLL
jgi:hypothetical protein